MSLNAFVRVPRIRVHMHLLNIYKFDKDSGDWATVLQRELAELMAPYNEFMRNNFVGPWRWHKTKVFESVGPSHITFQLYLFVREFEDATLFKLKFNAKPWQEYTYQVLPHWWEWQSPDYEPETAK